MCTKSFIKYPATTVSFLCTGLTIERKRPGGTPSSTASPIVDKVEITKIPVVPNNGTSSPRDFSFAKADDETPLNLSMKSSKDSASPYTYGDMASISVAAKQIPSDYYACKCGEVICG